MKSESKYLEDIMLFKNSYIEIKVRIKIIKD